MNITSAAQEKVLDLLESKSATEFFKSSRFRQARQIVDITKGFKLDNREKRLSK